MTDIGGKTETGENIAADLDQGLGPDLPIENVIEGTGIGIVIRKAEKRIGGIETQDGEGGQIIQSPMPGDCIRWSIKTLSARSPRSCSNGSPLNLRASGLCYSRRVIVPSTSLYK